MFEETRRCPRVSSALLGTGGECGTREGVYGSLSKGCQGGGDRWSYGLSLVQIRHQPPHLLQSLRLHEDVVLGQEESGYFGEFSHRGAVGVGNNGAQAVQRVVQVVHPPSLAGVDAEPQGPLLLALLSEGPSGLVVPKWRAPFPGLQRVEAILVVARVFPAALVGLRGLPGEEISGRCKREPAGASSTMASAKPEGWLPVALRQVEERVVADGLKQILFVDIHFLFQSRFWPGKVYRASFILILYPSFCFGNCSVFSRSSLQELLFPRSSSPSSLLSSVSAVTLQEGGCESEASTCIHLLCTLRSPLVARIAHVPQHFSNCARWDRSARVPFVRSVSSRASFLPSLALGRLWLALCPACKLVGARGPSGLSARPIRGAF